MRDESPRWQQILATGFSTAAQLLNFLDIPIEKGCHLAEQQFATRVPKGFAMRMEKGNPNDPLLLQVLASSEELLQTDGFTLDPLNEKQANLLPGLIHKYHGRVLLTVTGACAVNCRYCFRRHFPYQENNPGRTGWSKTLEYIRTDSSIHEVIFSGGDPLLARDETLRFLIQALETIPHLLTLRIHTRVPIVLPERMTQELCKLFKQTRLKVVMVMHANHPHELNAEVKQVCELLRENDCYLLNQSVLLAGVNDEADILIALSHRLFACEILPYYLHLLDKVQGTAHFNVEENKAKQLMKAVMAKLPGYLVPRLAKEIAGDANKSLV